MEVGGPTKKRIRRYCSGHLVWLLLLLLGSAASAYAQDSVVTEESSSASVRGGCGATASSHGVCGPDGKLRCRAGWTGSRCDQPVCAPDCSPEHGNCQQPGECVCDLGWRGVHCDECVPPPGCQHGSCNDTSFQCHCHRGWIGPHCADAICRDGCHATRGYCDVPGECKCSIGWGGSTCTDCAVVPGCQNGFCQKPLECRCFPGWTGHLCQKPMCAEGCHPEHGSCSNPGECRCEVGWFGPTCSTCHPYPGCKNGRCDKPWECTCEPGWTGMMCDKRIERASGYCDLNQNACLNGGTCIDVLGPRNYTCSCPSLFTGKRCDYLAERRPRPGYFQSTTAASTTITVVSTSATTINTSTTAMTTAAITPKTTTTTFAPFEVMDEDEYDPVIEDYDETPRGQHSRIHSVTASPRKLKELKRQREFDAKNARRIFLQNRATISFRQPKTVTTVRTPPRPLKLPFNSTVDRKHLSLPVFLPRVTDIVKKNGTKKMPGDDVPKNYSEYETTTITSSAVTKERGTEDELEVITSISTSLSDTQFDDYLDIYTDNTSSANNSSNNIFSETVDMESASISDTKNIINSETFITSDGSENKNDDVTDAHLKWEANEYSEQIDGEQTIKDLLEEYEKPKPTLVVDYNNPQDKNVNEIRKTNDNQIEDSLNFINEKRRFLEPESLSLNSENSPESPLNGPSRPMFLVAVRPLPHPDGTVRPIASSSGNPIFNLSNYPPATFLQESRNGKFLPQGRSAGSTRGAIHFSSPSFSVSQPHTFNIRHFAPQTRLSRRIGHASSAPYAQSFASEGDHVVVESQSVPLVAEAKNVHFYEEHSDGSVHIGVNRHTPHEEIINAFIEIKKSNT